MKGKILLLDNGSLRPAPTLQLRQIARQLSARAGQLVEPVSILHSHKVDPALLGGEPAASAKGFLQDALDAGVREFVCLPMFIGPSLAITEYLPGLFEAFAERYADLRYSIGEVIAGPDPARPDPRLVAAVVAGIEAVIAEKGLDRPEVAIVDHGTPLRAVNAVREAVVAEVKARMSGRIGAITGCAMERKPEPEYAFNEPMLEALREREGFESGDLVVSMFFLLAGRHAGPDGDVAEILRGVNAAHPGAGAIYQTGLLGENELLLEILEDRLKVALEMSAEA